MAQRPGCWRSGAGAGPAAQHRLCRRGTAAAGHPGQLRAAGRAAAWPPPAPPPRPQPASSAPRGPGRPASWSGRLQGGGRAQMWATVWRARSRGMGPGGPGGPLGGIPGRCREMMLWHGLFMPLSSDHARHATRRECPQSTAALQGAAARPPLTLHLRDLGGVLVEDEQVHALRRRPRGGAQAGGAVRRAACWREATASGASQHGGAREQVGLKGTRRAEPQS